MDIISGIWQWITGFFGGIANALIENPGVAIALGIAILLAIILTALGIKI